jgi:hypothetical protein
MSFESITKEVQELVRKETIVRNDVLAKVVPKTWGPFTAQFVLPSPFHVKMEQQQQQWKEQRAISLVNYLMRAPRVADFDQITAAEFNILKKVGFFPDHYIDIYDRDGTEWFRIPEYDGPDEW